MSFDESLKEYENKVDIWLDAAKKQVAAVARLQKAVEGGNVRDLEKMRQSAQAAEEISASRAEDCGTFEFDVTAYLKTGYLDELKTAAAKADVRLYERDGVIFCYAEPVSSGSGEPLEHVGLEGRGFVADQPLRISSLRFSSCQERSWTSRTSIFLSP